MESYFVDVNGIHLVKSMDKMRKLIKCFESPTLSDRFREML